MILTFETAGMRHEYWVKEYQGRLEPEIYGIRAINRILLAPKIYADFITATEIGDYEAVKYMLDKVLDIKSANISFPAGVENILGCAEGENNYEDFF